jgi:chitin synthase
VDDIICDCYPRVQFCSSVIFVLAQGQKIVISDEGKFDPASIPRKRWEEYQAELWEAQTQRGGATVIDDTRSEMSGYSYGTKSYGLASEYGGHGNLGLPPGYQSRPMSQLDIPISQHRGPSRLSMAASDVMSQRSGGHPGVMEMSMLDLPSDDSILAEI